MIEVCPTTSLHLGEAIYQASPMAIVTLDFQGRVTFWNPAAERIFGWRKEEVLGRPYPLVNTDAQRAEFKKHMARSLAGEIFQGAYIERCRRDGQMLSLNASTAPLKDERDQNIGILIILEDITERRATEKQLQETRQHLDHLFDIGPGVLYTCRTQGDFDATFISSNIQEVLGYCASQFTEKPSFWLEHVHPDDKDRVLGNMEWLFKNRRMTHEYRFRHSDGSYRWMYDEAKIIRHPDGGPEKIVGTWIDITERKQAEQQLQNSEKHYRHLFETMVQGVVYQDAEGQIISANPAAEKILGLSLEQMQGRTSLDPRWRAIREDGSDFPGGEHAATIALREGREVRDVLMGVFNPDDNAYRWIKVHAVPQFGEDGRTPVQVFTTFEDITARYLAEWEVRASEERFHNLFEHAPDGMYLIDLNGTFLDGNTAAEEIIGYRREELIGKSFLDLNLLDPQDLATAASNLVRAAQGETTGPDELWLHRRDGDRVPVEVRTIPLRIGEKIEILGIARDISARKEAEKQFKEKSELLEATLSSLDEAIFTINPENRTILSANRSVERIFGYAAEEVIGRDTEFIHAHRKSHEDWARKGDPELERTGSFRTEWRLRRRDGTLFWAEISVNAIDPEFGWSKGVVSVVRDISERKYAEEALRQSEQEYRRLSEEFRTLLDGIPDSILLLDPDLRIIWTNRGFADNFGRGQAEVSGRYCYSLTKKRSEPCTDCPVTRCFTSGQTEMSKGETPDGRIWGRKAFPMKDAQGKVIKVIELASDITERIRMREEAIRTSRLASLGELAAGIAHEINNPNALVLLNVPVLQDTWPAIADLLDEHYTQNGDFKLGKVRYSRLREWVPELHEEILDGAKRIRRIVEDLKDFVRQSDSQEMKPICVNKVTQAALRLLANTIKKSTDAFRVELAEDLPQVRADFPRLEQVIVNLVVNACQALQQRSGAVTVSTRYDDSEGHVVFEVHDEGQGIPPENLGRITDPFFTTKRESGGTGLGLSVSARIVREHKGKLRFASKPGEGTTVTLELPVENKE